MAPPRTGNRKFKYSTVADGCYKSLGSLPVPREGRTVQSMDTLTTRELEGNVVYDSSAAADVLGYTIQVIFASFASFASTIQSILPLNSLESLTIPWDSIPQGVRPILSPSQPPPAKWSMYDPGSKCWRWSFEPTTSNSATNSPTTEQLVAHFFNSVALAVRERVPGLVQDDTKRHWMAEWSRNPMPGTTGYNRKPDLVLVDNSALAVDEISWWSPKVLAEYTKESFQPAKRLGKTMDTKAYLTFLEQPWRRFVLGLSICNSAELRLHFYDRSGGAVSPPFNIHTHPERLIHVLCAVAFGNRGCIGFDVTMTIKPVPARIRGLLAFVSHAPGTPTDPALLQSSPESSSSSLSIANDNSRSPPVIGTILVGDELYELVDILFSSPGFLGRGTVCYLARRDNVLYVIKDHWVRLSPHREVLNEIQVMERLRHIEGVPKLHSHWVVVADSVVDCTERYREEKWRKKMKARRVHLRLVITPYARPLTAFKSKKELVSCLRDIISVVEQAANAGILHRDCSLHNTAIEDLGGGRSRGLLLDWEFGVEVNESHEYSVGGTGTLPFMSVHLLDQIRELVEETSQGHRSTRKTLSNTRVFLDDDITVTHTHADDIESLFYVLIWIMILYDGPLSRERVDVDPKATVLGRWSDDTAANITAASDAKTSLLLGENRWKDFHGQVSPYFRDLLPLMDRWRKVVAEGLQSETSPRVRLSNVLAIFDDFIPTIPDEKPAELAKAILSIRADHTDFISSVTLPTPPLSESSPDGGLVLTSQKRLTLSDGVRSMDNPPQPNKRFKRGTHLGM